ATLSSSGLNLIQQRYPTALTYTSSSKSLTSRSNSVKSSTASTPKLNNINVKEINTLFKPNNYLPLFDDDKTNNVLARTSPKIEKVKIIDLVREKEYQTGWKIKTGNVLDSCNQRSIQQYMKSGVVKPLGVLGIDTTRSTYLVYRSPSSAIGFKKPIDMLEFFSWLASIEQGMLELVKVKCIFLRYHEIIVGNKLWRLDDVTLKVVLYRNMSFNKSEEYKKTFIGSGVGTGSVQVLQGVEFEVEPQEDHTFEVEPHGNVDHVVGLQEIWVTKGFPVKAKGNILGLEIIKDQSGNTLRVSQSRIHNEKLVHTLLKGHSMLSLEDSLSGDCDVEKNASTDVGMLDGFDRGLQTNIQVFVDFDYVMGRSITVMSRSIIGYGLMILGCDGSLKANLQHMKDLSTTEARYMTFIEA
nr:zinc finger, CCHC-type [Tanacetum cinerariifolium]